MASGILDNGGTEPWASPFRDVLTHGTTLIRELCWRCTEVDITRAGSLIALVSAAPATGRFIGRLWTEVYDWIRLLLISSVTIPGGDPLNASVVRWILTNKPRHHRLFTGRTEVSGDRAAALKKSQQPIKYSPHWNSRWFFHSGRLFVVTRAEAAAFSTADHSYDGVGGEDLTVGCLGWTADPVKSLVETCREYSERQAQFFVLVFSRDRYGLAWKPKARTPIRHLDTVHFDNERKKELLSDVRNYLSPQTQKMYQSRSMPYRRGYLFYGPPGTGKSSLSVAVAGEFGLDIYEVKIPSVASDADLEQMFQEIPPKCVVLLEDIDAVWRDRSTSIPVKDNSSISSQQAPPNCTLSGLLNVLDGVGSQEGRIVIMTTNRPEDLDEALVRPGRVDMKILLGNVSRASAKEMFLRMFSPELGCTTQDLDHEEMLQLAEEFASYIPEDTITPSLLQGFFQTHLSSPHEAVAHIASWVKREMIGRGTDPDFELIHRKERGMLEV